ncbi:signal peptidase I [Arthrobacter rhombi]|uniref:Signal peptidase I n=1 Tax=Arthrobacter rhombi TaxID=71253 RepID=A0A1R4FPF4_9MICC|nr:signal peptidase I [Arthrobacter rhombi]SJM57805.1 Signal peptidase I [Arthrobacter rhombi]
MNEQQAVGPAGDDGGAPVRHPRNPVWGWVREFLIVVGIALVLSFVIKTFFFRAFYIPSGSMEQTLEINDRIFVNLLIPGPFDLHRGDVVVFNDDLGWLGETPPTPTNPVTEAMTFVGLLPNTADQHLVKRLIGMPGDTVECCSEDGRLIVNGEPITEPYIYPGAAPSEESFKVTVPAGKAWVMGDHRNASADSRFHPDIQDGFIDTDSIEGKAVLRAWPLDRFGTIDGHHEVFADVPNESGH